MSAALWTSLAGGAVVLALVFWPDRQSWQATEIRSVLGGRRPARRRVASWAALAVVFATSVVYSTPVMAATLVVVTGLAVWALNIRAEALSKLVDADQLAQFTSGLANQATVAPTVVEAVREAAPLVSGRVGDAARKMVEELWIGSLPEAAERFATEVGRPLAAMTSAVLIDAHSGGIKWANLVEILDTEAGQAAETARLFYNSVGRMMVQATLTLVFSAGLVAMSAMTGQSARDWLAASDGQATVLAAAGSLAALYGWLFSRAQGELR